MIPQLSVAVAPVHKFQFSYHSKQRVVIHICKIRGQKCRNLSFAMSVTAIGPMFDIVVSCPFRSPHGGEGGGRLSVCHPALQN